MLFNRRSFFLAATSIELALLLGYGRSQYTGNCINVINTKLGGAAGDTPASIVPCGMVFEKFLAASWHCDGIDTVAWRAGREPSTCGRGAGGITVEIFEVGAQGVSQLRTLCSGPSQSTFGTGGTRRARDGKLPADYRPPGGGKGTPAAADAPTDDAPTPPILADQAFIAQMQAVESLKAAVEALLRRLTAQEQTNESLARANDKLVDDVEAQRKVVSHEEKRRVSQSRRQSGDKTKNVKKTSKVPKDKSVRKDDPANAVLS